MPKREPLADLSATSDIIAARLDSLLTLVAALPDDVGAEARAAGLELAPYVEILRSMGADPDNPVPEPKDLPRSKRAAASLAPNTMPDGTEFPAPAGERPTKRHEEQ